eukprot:6342300-Alexandrium_andersonii.AAC.1
MAPGIIYQLGPLHATLPEVCAMLFAGLLQGSLRNTLRDPLSDSVDAPRVSCGEPWNNDAHNVY